MAETNGPDSAALAGAIGQATESIGIGTFGTETCRMQRHAKLVR